MADNIGIEIDGARELRSSIKTAQGDLKQLKALHQKVASAVLPFVIYNTPRQEGALLSTIRSSGTNAAAVIRAGNKSVPYAGVTHYGWPAAKFPKKVQRPHPWMVDAVHQSEPFWAQIFFQGLEDIIDKIGNQ